MLQLLGGEVVRIGGIDGHALFWEWVLRWERIALHLLQLFVRDVRSICQVLIGEEWRRVHIVNRRRFVWDRRHIIFIFLFLTRSPSRSMTSLVKKRKMKMI